MRFRFFDHVNYEDPDINVAIPFFAIHGNHDDPSGVYFSTYAIVDFICLQDIGGSFSCSGLAPGIWAGQLLRPDAGIRQYRHQARSAPERTDKTGIVWYE